MATYQELYDLANDSGLRNRTATAVVVAADTIRAEAGATPNNANRLIWRRRSET